MVCLPQIKLVFNHLILDIHLVFSTNTSMHNIYRITLKILKLITSKCSINSVNKYIICQCFFSQFYVNTWLSLRVIFSDVIFDNIFFLLFGNKFLSSSWKLFSHITFIRNFLCVSWLINRINSIENNWFGMINKRSSQTTM